METYTINGKSIEFDTFIADEIGRFQQAAQRFEGEVSKLLPLAETDLFAYLTGLCDNDRAFFDELIGPGTSAYLFGDRNNYRDITVAYFDFVEKVAEQLQKSNLGVRVNTKLPSVTPYRAPDRPKPIHKAGKHGKRKKGKR